MIPLYCLTFWLGLKLRESAAKLPPQELSDFLCQTVLVKGTAAMGTMLFFSFEIVSCFISEDSFDNGQCVNTSNAAMYLSVYLTILTTSSILSKTVPKIVNRFTERFHVVAADTRRTDGSYRDIFAKFTKQSRS